VAISVDNEVVYVAFSPGRVSLRSAGAVGVRARTTRTAILDLVDGRSTLLDAILADRVEIHGDLAELLKFHDALRAYVAGAVRSPGVRPLFARYREDVR
jgi:hypothetical protein